MPCFDIPKRLHRNGRPVVSDFSYDELIYRRFRHDATDSAAVFPLRDMSVNRSRFSESQYDVLYNIITGNHYSLDGIIQLGVGDVENITYSHPEDQSKVYTLKLIHEPEECMYPHSVVAIYLDGKRISEISPKSVKTAFRDSLMDLRIVIKPSSAT